MVMFVRAGDLATARNAGHRTRARASHRSTEHEHIAPFQLPPSDRTAVGAA